ncbi:MAG TPA: transglutaminase-like domain-containing protein [Vicinamibacteria bacterium]|nr:transglutaminase-like domain-containing protein [Vicinamibacteria bacterium]
MRSSTLPETPRRKLEDLLARPDGEVNLAEAALLVAAEEYATLDVRGYLVRLDEMGCALRQRLEDEPRPERAIMALNRYMFQELGFRGNTEQYYDARNSYLNEVMDRRVGIPITLSTVYMEVAGRAGLEVEGVGLPGHFVVRIQTPARPLLVDPFHGGTLLTEKDCQERLDRIFNGKVKLEAKMLRPCRRKDMLERLLRNLKAIYLRDQDTDRALRVVDLIVRIQPGSAEDLRDRGVLYASLDCYGLAARDLESYLALAPGAKDAEDLAARVALLRLKAARLN